MADVAKKPNHLDSRIAEIRSNFIESAGRIAGSLIGMLNRLCGQIYALLFLSPKPLSLDDIVTELGVSKGSVSVNIRLLEDFKLAKKVWVKGSRRDYYEAVATLPDKIIRGFFEKISRNIKDSLDMVNDCHCLATDAAKSRDGSAHADLRFMVERLQMVKSFYENADRLFEAIYSGEKIDTGLLKPFLERKIG